MSTDIGRMIRDRRKELHLTQSDIAQKCGVNKSTVCMWESGGISNMRRDRIARLAQILQISPADLIMEDSGSQVDEITQRLHEDPKLRLLFSKTSKMTQSDMDAMLTLASAILRERDGD